jgi:Glutathione S-transferase, N-terminal domain
MIIAFYEHPFSSYVQKAKTALYEKGIPFESKMIDGSEPVASEFAALWPIQRFPVIVDDGQFVFEATGIIEYLEARFPQTARLIPSDLPLAAEVRMWDRFFDNYVSYPQGGWCSWRSGASLTTGRAVRLGNQCSRPPTHFSTAAWPVGPGRSGRTSASPTARRRRRCSMLTGLTGFPSALLPSKPIAGGSSLARATPARWTMRVPTGSFFRSAHPSIGTEGDAKTSLL